MLSMPFLIRLRRAGILLFILLMIDLAFIRQDLYTILFIFCKKYGSSISSSVFPLLVGMGILFHGVYYSEFARYCFCAVAGCHGSRFLDMQD